MKAVPYLSTLAAGLLAIATFCTTTQAQTQTNLRIIGQPLSTGLIQKNKEEVFFQQLAQDPELNISIDYKPVDVLGIKDTDQLRILKSGLFELVSLRVLRNSRDEPALVGLDLVGGSPDFGTAKKVMQAYEPYIDELLQKKFNAKVLGIWPFGSQIIFCKKPISGLTDMRGAKVRVIDQNLAKVMETLGATPVPMSFPEVHQALALGVVDCAVTDASSANSAGWPEVTTHQYPLGLQMSPNAYVINIKAWNKLNAQTQQQLQKKFKTLTEDIWDYSEELHNDAMACNTGSDSCRLGKKFTLTHVPVTESDIAQITSMLTEVSLPAWSEACDKVNKNCSEQWRNLVLPILEK